MTDLASLAFGYALGAASVLVVQRARVAVADAIARTAHGYSRCGSSIATDVAAVMRRER